MQEEVYFQDITSICWEVLGIPKGKISVVDPRSGFQHSTTRIILYIDTLYSNIDSQWRK
jgi:hypothetical protein